MRRISKGNDIPHINSIVDLGNALSLKYELPVGVHDIDNFIMVISKLEKVMEMTILFLLEVQK